MRKSDTCTCGKPHYRAVSFWDGAYHYFCSQACLEAFQELKRRLSCSRMQ